MTISSPSPEINQWAEEVSQLPSKEIINIFSNIKIDDLFIHKITSLLHIIKSGITDLGNFDYITSNTLIDALHYNNELECIGTGSYSSCFKTLDNRVFKINLLSDNKCVDAAISYAIVCHDKTNPLIPHIYNISFIQKTYVIEMELLSSFERKSNDYIPLYKFDNIIFQKNIEHFHLNINALHKSEINNYKDISIEHCESFINIIHEAKNNLKNFRDKSAFMDIGNSNIMWRGEQLVFNDPIF